MTGATLRGARLDKTDLSEVSLAGAKVGKPFPRGATLCNTTLPDGSLANPQSTCP